MERERFEIHLMSVPLRFFLVPRMAKIKKVENTKCCETRDAVRV